MSDDKNTAQANLDEPSVDKPTKTMARRRRGMTPFVPTDQQRHVVSLCAGVRMGHGEISRLILNPRTNRPINEETLRKHFAEELANGTARLKMALSSAFYKLVEQHSENSVLFGMRAILGFDDRNIPPAAFTMKMGDGDKQMKIEFVLPGSRVMDMAALDDDHNRHHRTNSPISSPPSSPSNRPPSSLRITPRHDDLVLDKVQPSAWKKDRGGFDWS